MKRVVLVVGLALMVIAGGVTAIAVTRGDGTSGSSLRISASAGGKANLGDTVTVVIPPGALSGDATVSIKRVTSEQALAGAEPASPVYAVDLGGVSLRSPATVRLRLEDLSAGDRSLAFLARRTDASGS